MAKRTQKGPKNGFAPRDKYDVAIVEAEWKEYSQQSIAESGSGLGFPPERTRRITRGPVGLRTVKSSSKNILTTHQRTARVQRCYFWLKKIQDVALKPENVFCSDEKMFKVTGTKHGGSSQNCCVWIKRGEKIPAENSSRENSSGRFSRYYAKVDFGLGTGGLLLRFFARVG